MSLIISYIFCVFIYNSPNSFSAQVSFFWTILTIFPFSELFWPLKNFYKTNFLLSKFWPQTKPANNNKQFSQKATFQLKREITPFRCSPRWRRKTCLPLIDRCVVATAASGRGWYQVWFSGLSVALVDQFSLLLVFVRLQNWCDGLWERRKSFRRVILMLACKVHLCQILGLPSCHQSCQHLDSLVSFCEPTGRGLHLRCPCEAIFFNNELSICGDLREAFGSACAVNHCTPKNFRLWCRRQFVLLSSLARFVDQSSPWDPLTSSIFPLLIEAWTQGSYGLVFFDSDDLDPWLDWRILLSILPLPHV